MVLFRNQKYACLNCLRGHRASTCEHKNRILLQVGKRGRRPQAESGSRLALVRNSNACHDSESGLEDNKYRVIRVTVPERVSPNSSSPNVNCACGANTPPYRYSNPDLSTSVNVIAEETPTCGLNREVSPTAVSSVDPVDESVVFTEKYVFVHVGGNLFRREVRPDVGGSLRTAKSSFQAQPVPDPHTFHASDAPVQPDDGAGFQNPLTSTHPSAIPNTHPNALPNAIPDSMPNMPAIPAIPNDLQNTLQNTLTDNLQNTIQNTLTDSLSSTLHSTHPLQHNESDAPIDKTSFPNELHKNKSPDSASAPLVIAPMQYVEYGQHNAMNLLNKIGVSAEEANQFWADDLGNLDLLYAPQCAIPGQCKCGEGCKCEDCYEHNGKHQ